MECLKNMIKYFIHFSKKVKHTNEEHKQDTKINK